MFTLNRVTTIGLGAGLVLVGCASPVGEASDDPTAQSSAAITTEETAPAEEGITDEMTVALSPEMASAFEMPANAPVPAPPSDDAVNDDGKDEKSDKWFGFGRLGWGGAWAPGLYTGLYGFPGYGYGYYSPFGFGYSRSIGFGTACGLYGCAFW